MQGLNKTQSIKKPKKSFTEKLDKAKERLDKITKDREKFQAAYEKRQAEFDDKIKKLKAEIKNINEQIFKPLKKTVYDFKILPEIDYAEQKKRKSNSKYDRSMKCWDEAARNMYKNDLEMFFFSLWEDGLQNFFGEDFDKIRDDVRVAYDLFKPISSFDIVLLNDTTVVLINDFSRKVVRDIPPILNDIQIFRKYCTYYENHKLYLALASKHFYPELEDKCKEHGIAIIKQDEEKVVIDYEFMKSHDKIPNYDEELVDKYKSDIERFFFTSWNAGRKSFFGKDFDEIEADWRMYERYSYGCPIAIFDVMLTNSNTIALINDFNGKCESDITPILDVVKTFSSSYNSYHNHKVYLALASKDFSPALEDKCKELGLGVIKQEGDDFLIYDEFMKAY